MAHKKKIIVISLGGSIIIPDQVDYDFLKRFKKVINELRKKYKIIICTGGGHTARDYIKALEKEGLSTHARDMVGIAVTRLNAKLVSSFLQNCNKEIPTNTKQIETMLKKYDIVVCGGLKPGRTSDGSTAEIAQHLKTKQLINITNVSGLFDKDPNKHKDAKLIKKISHENFKKIMDQVKEKPGQHFILDSLAAEIARKTKTKIVILKGVENLKKCLNKKKFTGTIIY